MAGNEAWGASWFVARLPYGAPAPARARWLVSTLLTRQDPPSRRVEDASLVVHELVVNGLVHGAPDDQDQIEVTGLVEDGRLVISVRDHGDQGTVSALPLTDDMDSGRGLAMVAALSSSWSVDRSSGTRVSATLPL